MGLLPGTPTLAAPGEAHVAAAWVGRERLGQGPWPPSSEEEAALSSDCRGCQTCPPNSHPTIHQPLPGSRPEAMISLVGGIRPCIVVMGFFWLCKTPYFSRAPLGLQGFAGEAWLVCVGSSIRDSFQDPRVYRVHDSDGSQAPCCLVPW